MGSTAVISPITVNSTLIHYATTSMQIQSFAERLALCFSKASRGLWKYVLNQWFDDLFSFKSASIRLATFRALRRCGHLMAT